MLGEYRMCLASVAAPCGFLSSSFYVLVNTAKAEADTPLFTYLGHFVPLFSVVGMKQAVSENLKADNLSARKMVLSRAGCKPFQTAAQYRSYLILRGTNPGIQMYSGEGSIPKGTFFSNSGNGQSRFLNSTRL